jgi:hypothetical protein
MAKWSTPAVRYHADLRARYRRWRCRSAPGLGLRSLIISRAGLVVVGGRGGRPWRWSSSLRDHLERSRCDACVEPGDRVSVDLEVVAPTVAGELDLVLMRVASGVVASLNARTASTSVPATLPPQPCRLVT